MNEGDPILRQGSEFFTRIVGGYRAAKALFVANGLGVFFALEAKAKTAPELAQELACDPHALELLLRALVGMGVLEKAGGGYQNSPLATTFLVPGKAAFTGHNIRFQDTLWECWSNLETVVRTGRPHRRLPDLLGQAGQEFTNQYIRGMLPIALRPARAIAQMLGQAPIGTMIDVGCGPGAYTLALLDRHPETRVTMLDLEQTLAVTEQVIAESPHRDRMELKVADYLQDEYGRGFDLVFMSHTTHDESPDGMGSMFDRAFRALNPSGRIVVHDFIVDDETQTEPAWAALFSLNLMVYTDRGQVYSRKEYFELLTASGFVDLTAEMVLEREVGNPTCLIVGKKFAHG